ncbi:MAG TPA: hypothetical protein VK588_12660 [Chitinophagaceae bacterium]|nr:hypothetical protein [Chitinophagaceae bacterium]
MKISTRILFVLLLLMIAGILSSNMILKKQYNSLDKSDTYWTYNKILEKPFRHLHITGGNGTKIIYEQSSKPSVRLLREWVDDHRGEIKAYIKNDTLFINFDYIPPSLLDKFWLRGITAVRIFAPELVSVTGDNTNFEMQKLKQRNIIAHITGKSRFEVETMFKELDSVNIYQQDSSEVIFEVSPDYKVNISEDREKVGVRVTETVQTNRNESIFIKSVRADINNFSLLDIGHAQINSLQLNVSDSAAIILSGGALSKINGDSIHQR